jgi:5'-nucleotidase/UDP-sugar diphosphatase
LIAIAQMAKVNADLAVMNSGGIRADLPAGNISYNSMYQFLEIDAGTVCL